MRTESDDPIPALGPAVSWVKLRPLGQVLLAVMLAMFVLNLLLILFVGQLPQQMRKHLNPQDRADIVERIRVVEGLQSLPSKAAEKLVVLIGFSTAREGVDPQIFDRTGAGGTRLLNVAGSGGSFFELSWYYDAVLTDSRLRPDTLILAIHPCWLAGRSETEPIPTLGLLENSEKYLVTWMRQWIWILEYRAQIHSLLNEKLGALRNTIQVGVAYQPRSTNPWRTKQMYAGARATDYAMATQLQKWSIFGWFNPSSYGLDTVEAQTFIKFLKNTKGIAANTVIVLMPESQTMRSLVPPVAYQTILQVTESAAPNVPVLDLRDAMPEAAFFDHAHLNANGRAQFSKLLSEWITKLQHV